MTCDRDGLMEILTGMLKAAPFDEKWYLNQYPDVAQAVENGEIASAREHYIRFGYFEGRLPGLNGFDFQAYCALYPDLEGLLMESGSDGKAQAHFIEYGYSEGRFAPDKAKA